MSNQIVITSGAKVRELEGVLTGTTGIVNALPINGSLGIPQLDVNGKILVSQLPNSVMEYQGTWNATTNTPYLVNGTGNAGDVYLVSVGGTHDFGAGPITFVVSDQVIYSGTIWQKASGTSGTVTSVGLSTDGNAITIGSSPITTSGTITANFAGTSGQYINGAGNLTTFPTLLSSVGLSMPSAFNVSNSPLTSNGTIAVTGAGYPSQYIRGDGTLADFPSSGGGGSSVSYYLNGGTSQGTIGGVTYYEMSKTADTGTGVDFPKSGDGLIVSFLTDAGDPAQLNIPAGNWNYEIYASMSSNGGTPEMYAELYVYDGTTFTLIATSSNEILYDGVNLNLYTFAMTVPSTTLTLTDRLAIKLYSTNSGGKTTTIHTQDSHLCQIITTFSTGITALNGLTAQVQYFATGTSGTDFNISSSTATHTFNIPDASATARGLITTGTQSIAGAKTFNDSISANYGIALYNGAIPALTSIYYAALSGNSTGLSISYRTGGGTTYTNNLNFPASNNSYAFPSASGTVALTSNLSSYVPYTGATTDVNLGTFSITGGIGTFTNGVLNGNGTNPANLYLKKGSSPFFTNAANYGLIAAVSSSFILISDVDGTNYKYASFNLGSLTNNTNRAYTLPDASGTLALTSNLSSYVPYTGATGAVNLGSYDLTVNGLTVGKGGGNINVNTVLGYQALFNGYGTQNDQNTAIGYRSLYSNTLGQYNTALGYFSLYSNVIGASNTGIGWYSLYTNTGDDNTATGYRALYINSTGAKNTAFGRSSLDQNSTGSNNTAIGFSAGYGTGTNYNTTGSNNIFIGYQSVGVSSTDSNRTFIGNSSTTSTYLAGNLLLGTTTDTGYKLNVNGTSIFTNQLYINPTNTSTTGLDVASDTISFRSDNLEGFKRQLLITMGSGTLIQFTAKGYGANYGTDLAFYTATTGGVNSSPAIYITGTNNRVGIKTGTPSYDLDVSGTFGVSSAATFSSTLDATIFNSTSNSYRLSGNTAISLTTISSQTLIKMNAAGYWGVQLVGANDTGITIGSTGNVAINQAPPPTNIKFKIRGADTTGSNYSFYIDNGVNEMFFVRNDGLVLTGSAAASPYNLSTTGRSVVVESSGVMGYLVSTRESKANIKSIKNIDFINQLNPVQFNYRKKDYVNNVFTDEIYDNITYGFIADEVEKVNKELVFYNENNTLAGVEYNSIIAILTKAVQEQQALITSLQSRLDNAGL